MQAEILGCLHKFLGAPGTYLFGKMAEKNDYDYGIILRYENCIFKRYSRCAFNA